MAYFVVRPEHITIISGQWHPATTRQQNTTYKVISCVKVEKDDGSQDTEYRTPITGDTIEYKLSEFNTKRTYRQYQKFANCMTIPAANPETGAQEILVSTNMFTSFRNFQDAASFLKSYRRDHPDTQKHQFRIVECIIPKGCKYLYGYTRGKYFENQPETFASAELIINRDVTYEMVPA